MAIDEARDAVISTHALREEGDIRGRDCPQCRRSISTHALREEGDQRVTNRFFKNLKFLPTPSARRATYSRPMPWKEVALFLPTPSARRATSGDSASASRMTDFYPRPPRGGRPGPLKPHLPHEPISTHALREEGDRLPPVRLYCSTDFYPRPPRGGRLTAAVSVSTPF